MSGNNNNGRRRLVHLISSNHWGGIEQYALDICRHYRKQGWEVTAVTRDAKAVDTKFADNDINLVHAPLAGIYDINSVWRLAQIFRRAPMDRCVVHAHRYCDACIALMAKRLANRMDIRVVVSRHIIKPGHDTFLFRRICAKADAHVFVSKVALESFNSTWSKHDKSSPLPKERIHVLHNSLNISQPADSQQIRGPITAICHGTIVAGKGFETVIDALSMLRDIKLRLRIVGSGDPDYIDSLRNRAIARDVMHQIDWLIPGTDPQLWIGESHFGVQASSIREAFALESLRYMALGKPQVCVCNGAQSEYLSDGVTALFVPPADAPKLADAMRRLATDEELRNSIGRNALVAYNNRLDWKHFITTLDKIYVP